MSYPAPATHPGRYLKDDGDKDRDDVRYDPGSTEADATILFRQFGGRASAAATAAVTRLIMGYYAASTAENGAETCSLLSASLAAGLAATASPETSTTSTNARCAASMSPLLKRQHSQLIADDVATMTVTSVHAKGDLGVAALGFRHSPESEIVVKREHHTWKVDALFDGLMP